MKFNAIISMLVCLNFLFFTISENVLRSKTSNTLPGRDAKNFPETSALKDGKKGSFLELANHPIICADPSSALVAFQLYGKFGYASNSIAYQWRCQKVRVAPGTKPHAGVYDKKMHKIITKNPVETLKLLSYKCNDSLIKGFVIVVKGLEVHTKTTCIKAQVKECTKQDLSYKNINFGFVGKASVSQLGQFRVSLEPWQALQNIKGDYEKGDFRYRIRWCNIGDKPKSSYPSKNGSHAKMKVLYSDPKSLKLGDEYCQKNCRTNLTEKSRKCLEYGVIGCSVCDSLLKPVDPKFKASQAICQTFCNIYKKTTYCKFYEFKIVVKKKHIPTEYLAVFKMASITHKNAPMQIKPKF